MQILNSPGNDMQRESSQKAGGSRGHPARGAGLALRWWRTPAGIARERRKWIWTGLALMLLASVGAFTLTSVWNYYGLSMPVQTPQSGLTSYPSWTPIAPIPKPTGVIDWVFDAGEPLEIPVTTIDGAVYAVTGRRPETGRVLALSGAGGAILWEKKLNSVADFPPAVAEDLLFAGTRAGKLLAMDRHTGETQWTYDLEYSIVGPPIVQNGVLYAASDSIHAIDALTGERLWRHAMGGAVTRPIRLSGDVVAAITSDGNMNLIDASNGRRRLTFRLWFGTSAGPSVYGNALVIPGDGANVQALDLSIRDVPMEKAVRYWWTKLWLWGMVSRPPLPLGYLWQQREIGGKTAYPVGVDEDSAYLSVAEVDGSGKVVALDLETGQTRWEREFKSAVVAPAMLTSETVVFGVEGSTMFAVDKSAGGLLWEYEVEGGLATAPTLTEDGVILVPTLDGKLRAVR